MNPYESPDSETGTTITPCPARSWFFAKRFAVVAFLAGGSVVFYIGFRAFTPPPPPPGTALCGNAILGGLILMVFGTPIAGIVCALGGAIVGGIVDCVVFFCKYNVMDLEPRLPDL